MALRLAQLGVFRVLDVCLPAKTLGHISAKIGLLLGVASLVGSPRRSSVVVGNARLSRLLALGCGFRSEEHTSELQSLMRISYAVCCLQQKIALGGERICQKLALSHSDGGAAAHT